MTSKTREVDRKWHVASNKILGFSFSGQYRFYNNELQKSVVESAGKNVAGTGRRYVYEGLQRNRSSLWDNMEFWEHSFLDAVAAEREAAGMDVNPSDLITR